VISRLRGENRSAVKPKIPLASRLLRWEMLREWETNLGVFSVDVTNLVLTCKTLEHMKCCVVKPPWRWNDGRWGRFQEGRRRGEVLLK
jgi:hypothetical protein